MAFHMRCEAVAQRMGAWMRAGQLMLSFRPVMHQLPIVGAMQVCHAQMYCKAPSCEVQDEHTLRPMPFQLLPAALRFAALRPSLHSQAPETIGAFGTIVYPIEQLPDRQSVPRPNPAQSARMQVCFVEPPEFDFDITLGTGGTKLLDAVPMLKVTIIADQSWQCQASMRVCYARHAWRL